MRGKASLSSLVGPERRGDFRVHELFERMKQPVPRQRFGVCDAQGAYVVAGGVVSCNEEAKITAGVFGGEAKKMVFMHRPNYRCNFAVDRRNTC